MSDVRLTTNLSYQLIYVGNENIPVLIIDEQEQIKLNQGESELDYSNEKEIIVNHKKTVKKKND